MGTIGAALCWDVGSIDDGQAGRRWFFHVFHFSRTRQLDDTCLSDGVSSAVLEKQVSCQLQKVMVDPEVHLCHASYFTSLPTSPTTSQF